MQKRLDLIIATLRDVFCVASFAVLCIRIKALILIRDIFSMKNTEK